MSVFHLIKSLWVLRFLVISSLAAASVLSFAGYYSVTYTSSGTATHRGSTYSYTQPYSQFGGGSSPFSPDVTASFSEEDAGPWQIVAEVAECEGAIVATFAWHPDNPSDLPPKVAILKEYSYARWDANIGVGFATPGFADDGLGHVEGTDGQTYGESTGVKYTVVSNPGQQWSLPTPRSPHVKGTSEWGLQWGPTARARLTYSSALYPIWIDTTNTVNAGGLIFAEASRPTNAYLTCSLPNSHFDSRVWSASGQLVKGYNPTTASAHPVPMNTSDWQQPSPTWHYYAPGQSTINCQARIWTDDGLLNQTISTSKDLGVEKVEVGGTTDYSQLTEEEDWVPYIYTNTNPSVVNVSGNKVGMVYDVTSGASTIADHFPPGGQLVDAQLILAQWNVGVIERSTNSEFWLDNSFPYGYSPGAIFETPNGSVSAYLGGSDSPAFGGVYGTVIVSTTFEMHILYKASPSGSIYIPASRFLWTWNASGHTAGQPDGYGIVNNIAFPEWDDLFENTGGGGGGGSKHASAQGKSKGKGQENHAK